MSYTEEKSVYFTLLTKIDVCVYKATLLSKYIVWPGKPYIFII